MPSHTAAPTHHGKRGWTRELCAVCVPRLLCALPLTVAVLTSHAERPGFAEAAFRMFSFVVWGCPVPAMLDIPVFCSFLPRCKGKSRNVRAASCSWGRQQGERDKCILPCIRVSGRPNLLCA